MTRAIIIIGLGGAVGSIFRWLISQWMEKILGSGFPWGTLVVNFIGCLLIGVIIQVTDRPGISAEWRLLLATGFCGGFTTFSAFALENLKMLGVGNYQGFFIYVFGSVVAGVLGVLTGMKMAEFTEA